MDEFSVLARLRENVSLDAQEAADALPLCRDAARQVERRTRPGAPDGDDRLVDLAAALARRSLLLRQAAREDTALSFRAGDVSVTHDTARLLDAARALCREAEADAAELLYDRDFFFQGVRA